MASGPGGRALHGQLVNAFLHGIYLEAGLGQHRGKLAAQGRVMVYSAMIAPPPDPGASCTWAGSLVKTAGPEPLSGDIQPGSNRRKPSC
jgi:hypothetical protein